MKTTCATMALNWRERKWLKSWKHFDFLTLRRHRLGQRLKDLLAQAQLEELPLVGFADDFKPITFPPAKGFHRPADDARYVPDQPWGAGGRSGQERSLNSARLSTRASIFW